MRTVSAAAVAAGQERIEELPGCVQEALGELAGAAKEGLLALSVGVGLGVLHELMEAEVDEVVGPKGRHDPNRTAVRHGHEAGAVTLGGRRVPVERPRPRTAAGAHEVELGTYAHFAARDQLTDVMLEWMLAGVSTRRYARTGEPVGSEIDQISRSTSKSAVGRDFVSRTREHLIELMSRPLDDLRLAVVMLDGIELKGRCCVVALGIDTDGVKHPSGCGTARPRTPPWPPRCWPTSPSADWTSSRACWWSSTAPRRCAGRSVTCSVSTRRCSAASVTRNVMKR
jgi:putative transposase